jgi:hydroxyethylthiazole kinase-like sugar kinase family protein
VQVWTKDSSELLVVTGKVALIKDRKTTTVSQGGEQP